MKWNFAVLVVMFLITGCGLKIKAEPKKETRRDPLEAYHSRPLETTQEENVLITRKKQMTVRYDCNGHVTSNKLETINSLSKKMTVNYRGRKEAWSYDVFNRTTKSGNRGVFVDHGQFVIDYAPTVFNMKVNEGINKVEYVFKKCPKTGTDANGNKICLEPLLVEKEGIVQIDIAYAVEIVPGTREFRPTPEQCQPKP